MGWLCTLHIIVDLWVSSHHCDLLFGVWCAGCVVDDNMKYSMVISFKVSLSLFMYRFCTHFIINRVCVCVLFCRYAPISARTGGIWHHGHARWIELCDLASFHPIYKHTTYSHPIFLHIVVYILNSLQHRSVCLFVVLHVGKTWRLNLVAALHSKI
jgi:hypothetical protein